MRYESNCAWRDFSVSCEIQVAANLHEPMSSRFLISILGGILQDFRRLPRPPGYLSVYTCVSIRALYLCVPMYFYSVFTCVRVCVCVCKVRWGILTRVYSRGRAVGCVHAREYVLVVIFWLVVMVCRLLSYILSGMRTIKGVSDGSFPVIIM